MNHDGGGNIQQFVPIRPSIQGTRPRTNVSPTHQIVLLVWVTIILLNPFLLLQLLTIDLGYVDFNPCQKFI
jgi:hypothetical protein